MSDDFFDDLDPGPLDESFFQQVDTLEQVALSQHPRGRSTTTSTTRSPPSKRQKLDPQQKQQWPHDSLQLQSDSRPSVIAERLEAEGDHQSADLAAQWEQALANLEAENARLREQQASLDELQRRVMAKEGEAASLRRQQSLAEQKNTKALQEEQAKNRQLQDQITSMKQQFVSDLERANTQRAFQRHEQEAAQRRAKMHWHQQQQGAQTQSPGAAIVKQKSPVKAHAERHMGFRNSFVDAKPGPSRPASPKRTPSKGGHGPASAAVSSPTPSRPQSPLASRAGKSEHVTDHISTQLFDPAMDLDGAEAELPVSEPQAPDLNAMRSKIISSLFAHRYIACEPVPGTHRYHPSAPTFHLLTTFKTPSMAPNLHASPTTALFSAVSTTAPDVPSEEALQGFTDNLAQALLLFLDPLTASFASEDASLSQAALQPLAALLDWLSLALLRFQPYFARALIRRSSLFKNLDEIIQKCASVKPPPSASYNRSNPKHAGGKGGEHESVLALLMPQSVPKLHYLLQPHVRAHLLFPAVAVLESVVWSPEPDTFGCLDAGLIDTHLVSTLLDAALPPTVLYRALQWLCLTARHKELYRSLLAAPFKQASSSGDHLGHHRIPLIETLAGYLHFSSSDASASMLACIHQMVLKCFLRLYCLNEEAPTILSSSQALVPKLIFRMAWDVSLLYESDGEGFGRLPPHLVVLRLCGALKLLYMLAGTPRQLQRFNLKTQIHQSLAHYNGVLQMFNVSIGRLATAPAPHWLDARHSKLLDEAAEPAQLLLDLVFSPEEQDDLYTLNQGEELGDADMTNDHEEQQIAAEHLAEIEADEDDEATLDE